MTIQQTIDLIKSGQHLSHKVLMQIVGQLEEMEKLVRSNADLHERVEESLPDRMAATFNACKGVSTEDLADGIVSELIEALDDLVTHVLDTEGDMWDWARETLRKANVESSDWPQN